MSEHDVFSQNENKENENNLSLNHTETIGVNNEDVADQLKNYGISNEDIYRNLKYTAFDGRVDIDWDIMKKIVEIQLRKVIDILPRKENLNNNPKGVNDYVTNIIKNLNCFKKPPFTIQRICELLLFPTRYYKTQNNLLFAFNKLIEIENL